MKSLPIFFVTILLASNACVQRFGGRTQGNTSSLEPTKQLEAVDPNIFKAQYKVPSGKPMYLFSYVDSEKVAATGKIKSGKLEPGGITKLDFKEELGPYLQEQLARAKAFNQDDSYPITSSLAYGAGFYAAEDPFSSHVFGDALLIAQAREGVVAPLYEHGLASVRNTRLVSAIKSDASAIFHKYFGIFASLAVVIRDEIFFAEADGYLIKKPEKLFDHDNWREGYIPPPKNISDGSAEELLRYHMHVLPVIGYQINSDFVSTVGRENMDCHDLSSALENIRKAVGNDPQMEALMSSRAKIINKFGGGFLRLEKQ